MAASCVGTMWNEYEGTDDFDHMVRLRLNHLIELVRKYRPSLPSNLDKTAKSCLKEALQKFYDTIGKPYALVNESEVDEFGEFLFSAGAEWMAEQGWINDGSMPPETKQESDTLQGHREWTESKPVLAWDSMYGCRIDWTRNGKWMSEQTGGYTGQVCHRIIAWRPIPEYKERQ